MSGQLARRLTRNPWVVISVMGHAVVLAAISVVVVTRERVAEPDALAIVKIAEAVPEEPEIALPEVMDRDAVPVLMDEDLAPNDLSDWIAVSEPSPSEPSADPHLGDLPPGDLGGGTSIGPGGPGLHGVLPSVRGGGTPGGVKFRDRFDRRTRPGGAQTHIAVREGLLWLMRHQDEDGRWDAARFMKHDREGEPCHGAGNPTNDVGVTGLALLAFLGDGHTLRQGSFKGVVRKAVKWLQRQQDQGSGLIGDRSTHEFHYSHAIAALALCEAYGLSDHAPLRKHAQAAIHYIQNARNPYAVWRYYPRDGDNDSSVTGWMVLALASAKEFRLTVDERALADALVWLDQVTDPATGRCGYARRGERSSRQPHQQARFPVEKSEAMTAVGLLCRFFLGQDPKHVPVMNLAAATILARPPLWDERAGSIDMYYWYYASFALFQMGGARWEAWSRMMTDAVVKSQRSDGSSKGSWDPVDPWGDAGGRVYSTAIMVLCLEAYYRYASILGGR